MVKISDALIRKIKKYCDNEQMLMWQAVKKRAEDIGTIRIANTGLVSSGKSSLFNSLINSINEERFPTGAARKTLCEDKERLEDNIYLIDTPGIDVREEDDEKAFESVMSSDIIMVVHNVKLGALQREEYNWISKICSTMKSEEEIKDRLIVVLSWIDERDGEADFKDTIDDIKRMIFEITNVEVDMFLVSAKRFITGARKGNEKLIEKSNVQSLKKRIMEKARNYSDKKEDLIDRELKQITEATIDTLKVRRHALILQKKDIEKKVRMSFATKQKTWGSLSNNLRQKLRRIESLKSEYSKI